MDAALLDVLRQDFRAEFTGEPTRQYQSLSDRIRRSLSWMKESLASPEATPARFIKMWIALNSLYGRRHYEGRRSDPREQRDFESFVGILLKIGAGAELQHPIRRTRRNIRSLISNPFLWNEYWRGERDYRQRTREAVAEVESAAREGNVKVVLDHVFTRLLVLRNQIVHGSAAADTQATAGA